MKEAFFISMGGMVWHPLNMGIQNSVIKQMVTDNLLIYNKLNL